MKRIVVMKNLSMSVDQKERLEKLWEITYYNEAPKDSIEWFNRAVWFDVICSGVTWMKWKEIYDISNKYIVLPFVVAAVTWVIWSRHTDTHVDDVLEESMSNILDDLVKINDLETECRIPTKDNPFMNPGLSEFSNDTMVMPKSCPSYNNVGVQNRVEELFNEDLYRDVTDVFGKNNSQRQFYTVPGNQVPNDQGSFAQWCYGQPKTCKEGNSIACLSDMGNSGGGVGQST